MIMVWICFCSNSWQLMNQYTASLSIQSLITSFGLKSRDRWHVHYNVLWRYSVVIIVIQIQIYNVFHRVECMMHEFHDWTTSSVTPSALYTGWLLCLVVSCCISHTVQFSCITALYESCVTVMQLIAQLRA